MVVSPAIGAGADATSLLSRNSRTDPACGAAASLRTVTITCAGWTRTCSTAAFTAGAATSLTSSSRPAGSTGRDSPSQPARRRSVITTSRPGSPSATLRGAANRRAVAGRTETGGKSIDRAARVRGSAGRREHLGALVEGNDRDAGRTSLVYGGSGELQGALERPRAAHAERAVDGDDHDPCRRRRPGPIRAGKRGREQKQRDHPAPPAAADRAAAGDASARSVNGAAGGRR